MDKEWFEKRITIEECEIKHSVKIEELGPSPIPFGYINQRWLEFKSQIQDGDELWEFSSPLATWKHLCGRAGICIVRNGEIIDSLVTIMS
jgi:hypothetical protein